MRSEQEVVAQVKFLKKRYMTASKIFTEEDCIDDIDDGEALMLESMITALAWVLDIKNL